MGKIKIQVGKKDVEQAQSSGDFEQAPPGVYVAELKTCEPGHAKGSDGKPDKDRPYLACTYAIIGVGREGAKLDKGKKYSNLWDYVSFSEAAKWKMAQFGIAMGLPIKAGAINASIETEAGKPGTIIGTKVLLSVKADKDLQGDYKGSVRSVSPLAGDDADLFDDDEEGSEDLEDSEEEFDEEGDDDGSEDEDLLTAEELEEEDLKSLGVIAEEFDLDPKDFVVKTKAGKTNKVKTKAAVIEAILEAQGADEDEDEEEPF